MLKQEAADDPLEVLGLMERDALGAWAAWEAREVERRAALRLVKVLFFFSFPLASQVRSN